MLTTSKDKMKLRNTQMFSNTLWRTEKHTSIQVSSIKFVRIPLPNFVLYQRKHVYHKKMGKLNVIT